MTVKVDGNYVTFNKKGRGECDISCEIYAVAAFKSSLNKIVITYGDNCTLINVFCIYVIMIVFAKGNVLNLAINNCIVVFNVIVTKSINGDCFSGNFYLTYGTVNYVIVGTCSFTSRSNFVFNNNRAIGVTKSRNNCLLNKNFSTNRAVLTFCKTCFCTCGSNSLVNYLGVTLSSYIDPRTICKVFICLSIYA